MITTFVFAAAVASVLWWRRREFMPAFLVLPLVFAFGIHAAATHFITRYSRPLIPLVVVAAGLAAHSAWHWYKPINAGSEKARRRRSPR